MRHSYLHPILVAFVPFITLFALETRAATFSSMPLDGSGFFQAPENLVFDHLITGTGIVSNHAKFNERDVRENRGNAQTFTVESAFTLDKIVINYFAAATNDDNTATFQFFSVTSVDADTLVPGPIIDQVTFSSNQLAHAAGTLVFDIENTALSVGATYAVRFVTASSTPSVFKWAFADPFDDARRYENGKLVSNNEDYTIGLVAAIPEPSSVAVLLGGAAALVAVGRRRL